MFEGPRVTDPGAGERDGDEEDGRVVKFVEVLWKKKVVHVEEPWDQALTLSYTFKNNVPLVLHSIHNNVHIIEKRPVRSNWWSRITTLSIFCLP